MTKKEYELVEYDCIDGKCLILHEKTYDTKLGALSLDHRSIGEEVVNELNKLSKELDELTKTDDDIFKEFREEIKSYKDKINQLVDENKELKKQLNQSN